MKPYIVVWLDLPVLPHKPHKQFERASYTHTGGQSSPRYGSVSPLLPHLVQPLDPPPDT